MTSFSLTYTPPVSSPLNPHAETKATTRRRRNSRRNVGISPAERLARFKAAEAWRSLTMMQEAAEYERVMVEAIIARTKQTTLRIASQRRRDYPARQESVSKSLFQLPDLSFLTPRKVALAVGLVKRLPSQTHAWLTRCADTSTA